jgi:hypothetical protein
MGIVLITVYKTPDTKDDFEITPDLQIRSINTALVVSTNTMRNGNKVPVDSLSLVWGDDNVVTPDHS